MCFHYIKFICWFLCSYYKCLVNIPTFKLTVDLIPNVNFENLKNIVVHLHVKYVIATQFILLKPIIKYKRKKTQRIKKNINDLIKILFSLDLHYDENDIHNGLLADLITGYIGKYGKTKGNVVRWKMHFRKYCPLPSQQECSVMENFDYLERSGLIAVGKYDILENIFRFVDERALCNIKDASQMINAIKSTSSDARGMYLYMTLFSLLYF